MKRQDITIKDPAGLHLRVAAGIARITQKHDCHVSVSCENCPKADGCSVLQLILLGASHGKVINVEAEGPDEERAALEIAEYFESGLGI